MIDRSARGVILQFDSALDVLPTGKRLTRVTPRGGRDTRWSRTMTPSVEALTAKATARSLRYSRHRRFDLRDFIDLPVPGAGSGAAMPPEADFEGISFCGEYLWIVGSHSAARQEAEGRTTSDAIAAFARVRRSGNRFLLARIPVTTRDATQTQSGPPE